MSYPESTDTKKSGSEHRRGWPRDAAGIDFIRTSSSQSPPDSAILASDENPIVPATQEPEPDMTVDVEWDYAWERAVRATLRHDAKPHGREGAPKGMLKGELSGTSRTEEKTQAFSQLIDLPFKGCEQTINEEFPLVSPADPDPSQRDRPIKRGRPETRTRASKPRIGERPSPSIDEQPSTRSQPDEIKVAQTAGEKTGQSAIARDQSVGPQRRARSGSRSSLVLTLGLIILAGMLSAASYLLGQWIGSKPPLATGSVSDKQILEDVSKLGSQVAALASSLDRLEKKVDNLPKPVLPIDLNPIHVELDELGRSMAKLAPLPERTQRMDEGVQHLELGMNKSAEELVSLKDMMKQLLTGLASFKAEFKQAIAALSKLIQTTPASTGMSAIELGAKFFIDDSKHREAAEVFRLLVSGNPQDARVYYFAALANGVTTNNWGGETVRYVATGVELEKAGKPERAEIDAAFVGIPIQFTNWLNSYRQRAR